MHFTLPHKNKKKTAVRHTFQTFITLSHWFLIFVNKRGRLKEDERTGQKALEDEMRRMLEDKMRWVLEDEARRPPSY